MHTFKKQIILLSIIIIVLLAVSYILADRYLIRHVEIADVTDYAAEVSAGGSALSMEPDAPAAAPAQAQAAVDPAGGIPAEDLPAGDWSYRDEDASISITKVSSGSGRNALTYFVADVTLADAETLRSAFADNQFGRNIIADTSEIAAQNGAVFAINGDYYGFRTDGIEIRNGVIYRDEPARMGLAFYRDGSMRVYDETQTSAKALLVEGVWNTLSFGPALIDDGVVETSFEDASVDKNIGNRSIQGRNPRTGVGMVSNNHFVFVVVDGRSSGYSMGVTLAQFAEIFQDLGCSEAYNIDGGGSSTMYFMGQVVNNPLGRSDERGTSDILFIGS